MVSIRCKMLVKSELDKLNIPYRSVDLGEVDLIGIPEEDRIRELKTILLRSGLEIMDDKKSILIEKLKKVVIEMVHYEEEVPKEKHSTYISERLNYNYTYLATLFSETIGMTVEQYFIAHKIEKAKELLLYDELTLTEIAFKLNYSSVAHLSSQFKKVTGLTPSFFKKLKNKKRIPLEDL